MAALTIGDLYLNEGDAPYLIVRHAKGNRTRAVYIDSKLAEHLLWFIEYKNHGLLQRNTPDAPLFAGHGGAHCPPITLMKSFKRAAAEAGLPERYSIHACRHTYATFLLHDTGDLRYTQRQLGHTSILMTSLYANILPEMNGRLANKIQRD
jgi:site-specific recombinase XerD